MERGDTGLGRDAYGPPRRRRLGDRRAYRPGDGAGPIEDAEADDEYGQLLRRPGDLPPQPGRSRMRPPPGRFPPAGNPADGYSPNGMPGNGGPVNGGPANGGPVNGGPVNGGRANGGPMPGRHYRLPNGRLAPPRADLPYRPPTPGPGGDIRAPRAQPGAEQAPGPRGSWAPGGPPRPDAGPRAYANPPRSGFAGGPAGSRPDGRDGWGRLGTQPPRGVPAGTAGPVIRQRENAVPEGRPTAAAQPTVSIAPDGLESFARDLRALRAKAELDYPELAEVSHYTMKTLVSAAAGLRLPTLPVAVAYVRACGGNVAEWEERWQKLATNITADAAKQRHSDEDEREALPEPADAAARPELSGPPAMQDSPPESGEVYVITSAKPRQPGW